MKERFMEFYRLGYEHGRDSERRERELIEMVNSIKAQRARIELYNA